MISNLSLRDIPLSEFPFRQEHDSYSILANNCWWWSESCSNVCYTWKFRI